jgi:hypothetical protein
MRLAERFHSTTPMVHPKIQASIDDVIVRLVETNDGMKDTTLTIAVLAEIADQPEIQASTDPQHAAFVVAGSIHRLIRCGRLIAVDCETPAGGFTFVLPAGSRPSIALPIFVSDNRTRH